MSISTLLEIAGTGLNAQQLALNVTGENITNVNTPGYSRQAAILENMPVTLDRGFPLGNGVKVSAIQRNYDAFLQGQMIAANSASGEATTTNTALNMVQPLFSDLTSNGIGTSLQSFFSSWQDLTSNAAGVPERQVVLSTAQQVVDDLHRVSASLTGIKTSMDQSLSGITTDINDQLQQIAKLNGSIKQAEVTGGAANEMRDQRELLVRQLALNIGVTSTEQADGTLNVNLNGGSNQLLVTGTTAGALSLQAQASPSTYSDVMLTPAGGPIVNATSFIGGANNSLGKLGATLQMRDVTADKYLTSLNEFASTLATQVNNVFSTGYNLAGVTGVNFFTPAATVTAANIGLNITSAADIAAASSDPTANGTGNNVTAQSIASLYDKSLAMTGGNMTMSDFYNSILGTVGVDVQSAGRSETQSTSMVNQLDNLRESNSGVSLDEELSNLIKYQKAYQGAAKLVNVGSDMLDTILGMIR
jgi:flagellar hook-associated protein 1